MSGADIGWLRVYRQSDAGHLTLLWSMNKDHGEKWKRVQINVKDDGTSYQPQVGGVITLQLSLAFGHWEATHSGSYDQK